MDLGKGETIFVSDGIADENSALPHALTHSAPLAKRNKIALQVLLLQSSPVVLREPALWFEVLRVREDGRIIKNGAWSHADGRLQNEMLSMADSMFV